MHVLVTGGAGYIGSVIAARLLARGHAVTVFDDLSRGHRAAVPAAANFVKGDIRDPARVQAALLDASCDAIVHMAALAEVGESVEQPERYHDVNVNGTAAVIAAARAAAVGRLVFSSTAAVYGEPGRVPIEEDDELAPTNPYGASKLAGERLLEQARDAGDLAFTALRYFNACGADGPRGEDHDPESHLIPLALAAARGGTALRVFGDDYPTPDGTCVRDYVHVADLSDAHVLALEALPTVQGAFNLGTGRGDSVRRVLDTVSRITGLELRREVVSRRAGDPPALVATGRRAASQLGWRPRRSLDDAVRDAWSWMQAHPRGYAD
ncbi:MAG: UDP-glucose 4-epimerase GalE [Actinobacteria bacterium]|nr:UDP-glucose 4-epimerase GalE [Actinomycetota bacterium]